MNPPGKVYALSSLLRSSEDPSLAFDFDFFVDFETGVTGCFLEATEKVGIKLSNNMSF